MIWTRSPPLGAERVQIMGQRALPGEQRLAGFEPLLAANDLMIHRRCPFIAMHAWRGSWRRRTPGESDKCDGIWMDQLISAASRALAAGDPVTALKRVALRGDPEALALRGIAMAQLGELTRAKELLRQAARGFGPEQAIARAR